MAFRSWPSGRPEISLADGCWRIDAYIFRPGRRVRTERTGLLQYCKRQSVDRFLVTGVSGPIGAALLPSLESRASRIVRLVRGPAKNADQISWDPFAPLNPDAVSGFDAVIHLAGESVVGRWTDAKKKAIRDSRVQGTRNLASALAQTKDRPRVFICASAIGFYGNRGDELLTEESAAGGGFLAELSRDWEAASRVAAESGIRTVNIRIGLVLSPKGGALAKMLTPFQLGLGGRLGPGTQWWSWIHVDDIVGAIHHIPLTPSRSPARSIW